MHSAPELEEKREKEMKGDRHGLSSLQESWNGRSHRKQEKGEGVTKDCKLATF